MAEKLTPQQATAVNDRGGNLLVSAAAGSGKTKVLVDRLLKYVMDPVQPADLDSFLIITYTKAAAAELRGKIAAKLTKLMAQQPENRHLQRQMQRLYLTKISTVHAFCSDLIREYAYLVDVPGDFRVADENECAQLRETVMLRLLDDAYAQAQGDEDFRAFVDGQGLGRDDRLVPQILLRVYDSARCHLNPQQWLDRCVDSAGVGELCDASQTIWGRELMDDLFFCLDLQIGAMERCAAQAAVSEGMEKPASLLAATVAQLRYLRSSSTWDEVVQRKQIDYGRLVISSKCPDQELAERIKAVRAGCKKQLEKKLKAFSDLSESMLADMEESAASVRGIVALVRRFSAEFDRAKRSRRILDFADLEHRTLDLLMGKSRSGFTAAAHEISERFREIMVDEYQDSNAVQDAIFSALTYRKKNCFMVGDVKQSIYQFRLADPGIFLQKYNTFRDASQAHPGEDRKVLLSANFRSGGGVLDSVNDMFRTCMTEKVGGLYYGEDEALREGIPHIAIGEAETEFWAVDVQESTYHEEATFVAGRIRELTDGTHMIRDGDALRPIQAEDVAILLRSPGSVGRYYVDALATQGIRCATGAGEDLLKTDEIGVLRSILQTISNPRQDIPLTAALASPVFGFTADDLASLRAGDKRCPLYDTLGSQPSEKAGRFLQILQVLRREARMHTIAQLIGRIYQLTGMEQIYGCMDNGEARMENLHIFYRYAADFESSARYDLEQFLEHLSLLEQKGMIITGQQTAPGCVTLMSIHKSKGLEFPVVFVCGLGREFNRESARAHVLCDQTLGIGLSAVDRENRVRYPTLAKRAIAARISADSLSEEMRVLYVALTRARDRLIMTYASRTLQKDVQEIVQRMDISDRQLLTMEAVCPGEWVLLAALQRTEAGQLFQLGGRPTETFNGNTTWKIGVVRGEKTQSGTQMEPAQPSGLPDGIVDVLRHSLAFRYRHMAATQSPSKQTATQRKGRMKDAESAEQALDPPKTVRSWRRPSFDAAQADPIRKGTATHAAMQYIDYSRCASGDAVRQQVELLVRDGFMRREDGVLVDCDRIAAMFATPMGQRLAEGKTLREFKFSILDRGSNGTSELKEELVLLQGVVDCVLICDDGIIVVDFKTDYVTVQNLEEKVRTYRPQVLTYADAMERVFQRKVTAALLYFFHTGQWIDVSE